MPAIIEASKRLTHKYVDTCSHLDEWDDKLIFRFKKLRSKTYDPYYGAMRDRRDVGKGGDRIGMEEDGRSHFNLKLLSPREFDTKDVVHVVWDYFSHYGCAHTYDCCGCPSTRVKEVRRVGRREWHVELEHSRNY